jgi:transposase
MKHYVGLDVGLEETSICIVDSEGVRFAKPRSLRSQRRSAPLLRARGSPLAHRRRSLVAGHMVVPELHSSGLPIIVVEARHMRVSLSTMRNKTDRNDARGIAQMMRLGWFRAVHVKNVEMQKMRTLLSNRKLSEAQIGRHRKPHSRCAPSLWL